MMSGIWWTVLAVAMFCIGLAVTLKVRARRSDRRHRARSNRRKARQRAWDVVFGRRRHLRLAHHLEETERVHD